MARGSSLITAEEFRGLVEQAVDPITLINQEGLVLYQNPASLPYFGWNPEELIGQSIFNFVHDEDISIAADAATRVYAGDAVDRIRIRFRHKSQGWRQVEVVASATDQGNMILNTRDVTDHEAMVRELRETHDLFTTVFNAQRNLTIIADTSEGVARIVDANEAFARFVGLNREACIGRSVAEIGTVSSFLDRDRLMQKLRDHGRVDQERLMLRNHEGQDCTFLVDASIIYPESQIVLFHAVDITELERIDAQLRQSQRMEAVGQLSGGLAHDFNNILSVVLGHLDIATAQMGPDEPLADSLAVIRNAVERGSELSRKLLTFSREQPLKPLPVKVESTINSMLDLISPTLGNQVVFGITGSSMWECLVDPGQFENALMNLAINACDAMPQGGSLTVELADISLTEPEKSLPGISQGDYVQVKLSDTGTGMDQATLNKIFEPFFSTKVEGHGTGLGLSMVFRFVSESSGHIDVKSEPEMGTTFTILLPRYIKPGR